MLEIGGRAQKARVSSAVGVRIEALKDRRSRRRGGRVRGGGVPLPAREGDDF